MSAPDCGERCDGDGVGVQMMDAEEHGRGSGGTTAVRANPARSAPRLRHRSGSPAGPRWIDTRRGAAPRRRSRTARRVRFKPSQWVPFQVDAARRATVGVLLARRPGISVPFSYVGMPSAPAITSTDCQSHRLR